MAAASCSSGLMVESAAMTSTTENGTWVQTWATTTLAKARSGSVSHGIDRAIRPEDSRIWLRIPQLGWKIQIHRTALIAPGSTQGSNTTERTTARPGKRCRRKWAIAVPRITTAGADLSVNFSEFHRADRKSVV